MNYELLEKDIISIIHEHENLFFKNSLINFKKKIKAGGFNAYMLGLNQLTNPDKAADKIINTYLPSAEETYFGTIFHKIALRIAYHSGHWDTIDNLNGKVLDMRLTATIFGILFIYIFEIKSGPRAFNSNSAKGNTRSMGKRRKIEKLENPNSNVFYCVGYGYGKLDADDRIQRKYNTSDGILKINHMFGAAFWDYIGEPGCAEFILKVITQNSRHSWNSTVRKLKPKLKKIALRYMPITEEGKVDLVMLVKKHKR